ncbi:fimbria/pilus chaperone family protein [Collimonas humicola]|uniref:fimbria/pilus chaperone family protein n=1 Tax=Collimonas humicola TaxID=2825886 RepID=UPI001B8CF5E3|nr:fimbria/pilus chaperone family protein [Collimonas humicola]
MKRSFSHFKKCFALLMVFSAPIVHASLQLESSVVIIQQSDGEGVLSLRNNSSGPVLLHSEILDIEEDKSDLLLVTPPITRVEPGDKQTVRFILKESQQFTTERLKRATFEGIPQTAPNKVRVTVRQNIPVIIRPVGLAPNKEPWKLLQWQHTATGIAVKNPSPYVIRMSPDLLAQPAGRNITLPKNYILPGETLRVADGPVAAEKIRYTPASVNGYLLDALEAPVEEMAKL